MLQLKGFQPSNSQAAEGCVHTEWDIFICCSTSEVVVALKLMFCPECSDQKQRTLIATTSWKSLKSLVIILSLTMVPTTTIAAFYLHWRVSCCELAADVDPGRMLPYGDSGARWVPLSTAGAALGWRPNSSFRLSIARQNKTQCRWKVQLLPIERQASKLIVRQRWGNWSATKCQVASSHWLCM